MCEAPKCSECNRPLDPQPGPEPSNTESPKAREKIREGPFDEVNPRHPPNTPIRERP